MPLIDAWIKAWLYLGFVIGWSDATRPQFDASTDMGLVLVPADADVNSTIFRLRATDQDADFPLTFDISGKPSSCCVATAPPVVRVENLPCTLYNKVCQANVILVRRLIPGRLHDFVVRVVDTKGEFNSMQGTISVTNFTTPRDKIFPHIPSLIMVPEDAKPGTELDYVLVRSNPWSGKPVYIELWQPKEMFKIRQRQTAGTTRGVITLIGELDFETQSMFTLTMYATDPYTEVGKDSRNIAGLKVVVVVKDVQDVPPIFTLAPPLTKINNTVKPGDVVLRVHAEDGDKGVPRQVTYGLLPDNNPLVSFFNISESTGEIILIRPLEELTQITYVGAPVLLKVVAEEIRRRKEEPPAQSTVVEVGFLLGQLSNNPPRFESDNYMAWLNENAEPGSMVMFSDPYAMKVKDDDVGKAGVFALKLENNNGTFEVSPAVGERSANFIITVRNNSLINYEMYHSLQFRITAREVGPATNLSASVPVIIFLRDVNDNPPKFDEEKYEVDISENATSGTKIVQVHATDQDSGLFGMILYTGITGAGSEAFTMNPNTGVISVAMGSKLDRERTPKLQLSVEARDEVGRGLKGVVPFIVNLLDVNDNAPIFDKPNYEFTLNADLTNFTMPAFIKATDADSEPPNNVVRYEIIHGNYGDKFYLNEVTGELLLREAVNKTRYIRHNLQPNNERKHLGFNADRTQHLSRFTKTIETTTKDYENNNETSSLKNRDVRTKRAEEGAFYTLTARAYDLGVPHLSSLTRIRVLRGAVMGARIVLFVMPGEHPDPKKTADTLATITGGRVIIQEIRPYVPQPSDSESGKKSVIVARVEQKGSGTLVDIEKIRDILAANGVGVISGMDPTDGGPTGGITGDTKIITNSSVTIHNQEVTTYKAENKFLTWLLILLGLLILLALICLIICCICPGCPFYMEPRKRRIHSTETLIYKDDGRPKKHLRRKRAHLEDEISDSRQKQAWSADPIKRNWQFNRRNTKQYGLASLPGDVAHETAVDIEPKRNALSLRLQHDSPAPIHKYKDFARRSDDDRIYIEDVEAQARNYEADMESIQRHEIARGSDISRQRQLAQQLANQKNKIREQHFFREGNAEVLRLVTRGQEEERLRERDQLQERSQIHRPVTLVIDQQSHLYKDGKEILLQRFIEDQEIRQDLLGSRHDIEGVSMESHQHPKEMSPRRQEVLLIPQRLEIDQNYHFDRIGPSVQRLNRGDFTETRRVDINGTLKRESQGPRDGGGEAMTSDHASKSAENSTDDTREPVQTNAQTYTINEVELVRQNALLTRLLLEKEASRGVGGNVDHGSYLETQSLPGQVATATQTDRTTSTQTDRQLRSRSDNDDSDDENMLRKRAKVRKKLVVQPKLMKTFWIKSTIPEEVPRRSEHCSTSCKKKISDYRESKRPSVSPEVLQEISDSLDDVGNSSSPRDEDEEEDSFQIHRRMLGNTESYVSKTEGSTSPETEKDRFVKSRLQQAKEATNFAVNSTRKKGEPSFHILEKEISSLQKRIRTFGQKKYRKVDREMEEEEDDSRKIEKNDKKIREPKDIHSKKDTNWNKEIELKKEMELKKRTKLKKDLEFKNNLLLKKDSKSDVERRSDSLASEKISSQKKNASKQKKQSLKHQDAVQSTTSETFDEEKVKNKEKCKPTEDKGITKRTGGHFKIKRQSRLQVSKGTMKNIISRTKEVTKRKVKELKKSSDSSGDTQLIKDSIGNKEPEIVPKDKLDSKVAYTVVSTRIENPSSRTNFEDERHRKAGDKNYQSREEGRETFLANKNFDGQGKQTSETDFVKNRRDNEKVEKIKDIEIEGNVKDLKKIEKVKDVETDGKLKILAKDERINGTTKNYLEGKSVAIDEKIKSVQQKLTTINDELKQFHQESKSKVEDSKSIEHSLAKKKSENVDLGQTLASDRLNDEATDKTKKSGLVTTDLTNNLIKEASDGINNLTKVVTDKKDKLTEIASDSTVNFVETTTDKIDSLMTNAKDKKDILVTEIKDKREKLAEEVEDKKREVIEEVTGMKKELFEDIGEFEEDVTNKKKELIENVTGKKKALVEEISDKKKAMFEEISDIKKELIEDTNDAKDKMLGEISDEKKKLIHETNEQKNKLMRELSEKKNNLVEVADDKIGKIEDMVDRLIEKSKIDKLTDEIGEKVDSSEMQKTTSTTDEVKESSQNIKSLMLETDDMRFIDDSQESTVDTSDESHSTIRHLKHVPESEKTDTDLKTSEPHFDKTKESSGSSSNRSKDKNVKSATSEGISKSDQSKEISRSEESEETLEDLKERRHLVQISKMESSEGSSESFSDNVFQKEKGTIYRHFIETETSSDSFADRGVKNIVIDSKSVEESVRNINVDDDRRKYKENSEIQYKKVIDKQDKSKTDDSNKVSSCAEKVTSPTKSTKVADHLENTNQTHQVASQKINAGIKKSMDKVTDSETSTSKEGKGSENEGKMFPQEVTKKDEEMLIKLRDEDHERKMAKVLAEEQQRLQRLELLYKQFSGTTESDDSDSSTDSDMSSKTMLTTQPYHTPRHSPTWKTKNEELDAKVIRYDKLGKKLSNVDDSRDSRKSETTAHVLEQETEKKRLRDSQISRKRVDDKVRKQNLKESSLKPGSKIISKQKSPEGAEDAKLTSRKKVKEIPLTNDEFGKSIRDKSPFVRQSFPKNIVDSKKQQGKCSLLLEDGDKKLKREKSPLVVTKPKGADSKVLENTQNLKTMSSKTTLQKDTKKYLLEKSASATEIEKQLTKQHQRRKERSLSPQKEVRKHIPDEEISRDKSTNLGQKQSEQDERNFPVKGVEERKDAEGRKQLRIIRHKSPLSSEKQTDSKTDDYPQKLYPPKSKTDKDLKIDIGKEESVKAQSRYMSWYKQKREEMEKKRLERKLAEDEDQKPRWMKRSISAKPKDSDKSEARMEGTPRVKQKIRPSVNVESEQLKAIVRQGRKMRKGKSTDEDVTVQIFAPKRPPSVQETLLQQNPKHPLIQHSEYKYEKVPTPFYLHPPPAPYPSPQDSPEHFPDQEARKIDDDLDSGIAVSLQGGSKLRHQQLLEKKSVFDIAYNEAAPSHLRSDSSTPPS